MNKSSTLFVLLALPLSGCTTSFSAPPDGDLRGGLDDSQNSRNLTKPTISRLGIDYSKLTGIVVEERREVRRLEGEDLVIVVSAIRKADQEAEFTQGRFQRPDGRLWSIAADATLELEFKDAGIRKLEVFAFNSPFTVYDRQTDVTFPVPLERRMLLHWFGGTRVHK